MDVDRTRNLTLDEVGLEKDTKTIEVYHSDYFYGLDIEAFILRFPDDKKMSNLNKYFIEMANLVQEKTNILSFGYTKDGRNKIITHKQLALYLDVSDKTVHNLLYEYGRAGIIARIKLASTQYFVMNPNYAVHKNGVNSFVYDIFDIERNCLDDDLYDVKRSFMHKQPRKKRLLDV